MNHLRKKTKGLTQLTEFVKKEATHYPTLVDGKHIGLPYEKWCNNEKIAIERRDPSRTIEVRDNATGKKCALFGDDRGEKAPIP